MYQDVNSGSDSSDSEEITYPYDDLMSNEEFIQLFDMRNDDDTVADFKGFLMKPSTNKQHFSVLPIY